MINFVVLEGCYKNVINSFVREILPFIQDYSLDIYAKDNCVNVIFFTEDSIFENIGADKVNSAINCFYTHGLADKNWRDASKVDKFDYVFTNGDLWVEKLIKQGMSKDKILLGGYTRLDKLYRQKDYYIKKIQNDKKTILFAPTHTCSVTSYDKLSNIIEEIKDDYNIIVSPHPSKQEGNVVTQEEFLEADVIVGDFGSSMYEAWALGKPSVLPNWLVKDAILKHYSTSFEAQIYRDEIGYHAKSKDDFVNQIKLACDKGISKKEIDFIDGIFNKDLRGCGGIVTGGHLLDLEKKIV